MKKMCWIVFLLGCLSSAAFGYEGRRGDSVLLSGEWEFAEGTGEEAAQGGEGGLTWQKITLPGSQFVDGRARPKAMTELKFIWAKRTFEATGEQAAKLAVLRWNQISFGATAYINGQKVGENAPTGPYQVVLPKGIL